MVVLLDYLQLRRSRLGVCIRGARTGEKREILIWKYEDVSIAVSPQSMMPPLKLAIVATTRKTGYPFALSWVVLGIEKAMTRRRGITTETPSFLASHCLDDAMSWKPGDTVPK